MKLNCEGGGTRSQDNKNVGFLGEVFRFWLPTIACILFIRGTIAEARYIPSSSMEPTLQINDRVLVEKLSNRILGRKIERGDVLVFYPPTIESGEPDSNRVLNVIPFVPEKPPAFIKRVVGIPGDRIEVKKDIGILVNGKLVSEPSNIQKPNYNLKYLSDIGGVSMDGRELRPYGQSQAPIVVPPNHLYMMGDNHNNSSDSHVWGFLDQNRVVGRAYMTFWKGEWLSLFRM
jgi:signal peptidase I